MLGLHGLAVFEKPYGITSHSLLAFAYNSNLILCFQLRFLKYFFTLPTRISLDLSLTSDLKGFFFLDNLFWKLSEHFGLEYTSYENQLLIVLYSTTRLLPRPAHYYKSGVSTRLLGWSSSWRFSCHSYLRTRRNRQALDSHRKQLTH